MGDASMGAGPTASTGAGRTAATSHSTGYPTPFDKWLFTTGFATAMGEAISEFTDGSEQQGALREFFNVFEPRLMREGAINPTTAADLPGFARDWIEKRFRVQGYPSSEEASEQGLSAPASGPNKRAGGRRRAGTRGGGSGRAGRPQGRAQGGGANRHRSRSAGASPAPPAASRSICPDQPQGLRRSERPRRAPDFDAMYSSAAAGDAG